MQISNFLYKDIRYSYVENLKFAFLGEEGVSKTRLYEEMYLLLKYYKRNLLLKYYKRRWTFFDNNILFKADINNLQWTNKAASYKLDVRPDSQMTSNIGTNLMTTYLLPFEAISILLMMALVGAAHLSRKEKKA